MTRTLFYEGEGDVMVSEVGPEVSIIARGKAIKRTHGRSRMIFKLEFA